MRVPSEILRFIFIGRTLRVLALFQVSSAPLLFYRPSVEVAGGLVVFRNKKKSTLMGFSFGQGIYTLSSIIVLMTI